MDSTKIRLLAAVGGAVMGLVGVCMLAAAAAYALALVWGWPLALVTVGGTAFLIGAICLLVFVQPAVSTEAEMDRVEQMTAETLAALPEETLRALLERHPVAVLGLAAATGYGLASNPARTSAVLRQVMQHLT